MNPQKAGCSARIGSSRKKRRGRKTCSLKVYRRVCDVDTIIFVVGDFADSYLHTEREDDQNVRGDAFKTLFVARLSYDTTEKDLEREFGRFGPIERVRCEKNYIYHALMLTWSISDTHCDRGS